MEGLVLETPFLLALSRSEPVPGGGAAAAYAALVGLALLEKVCRLESRRRRLGLDEGPSWADLVAGVQRSAGILGDLCEKDSEAYKALAAARRAEAAAALQAAQKEAIACPVRIMREANEALLLARATGIRCKEQLAADVLVVCQLLRAGGRGAYHIATANLRMMEGISSYGRDLNVLHDLHRQAEAVFQEVEGAILSRVHGRDGQGVGTRVTGERRSQAPE
jgi:formiminotetrahydrofolate cyclodeaminase